LPFLLAGNTRPPPSGCPWPLSAGRASYASYLRTLPAQAYSPLRKHCLRHDPEPCVRLRPLVAPGRVSDYSISTSLDLDEARLLVHLLLCFVALAGLTAVHDKSVLLRAHDGLFCSVPMDTDLAILPTPHQTLVSHIMIFGPPPPRHHPPPLLQRRVAMSKAAPGARTPPTFGPNPANPSSPGTPRSLAPALLLPRFCTDT